MYTKSENVTPIRPQSRAESLWVSSDVVLFTLLEGRLSVLLAQRLRPPFEQQWALPGGFVHEDESLEHCANRVLNDKAGVSGVYLEQLFTFGEPVRGASERVVSVAYYALVPAEQIERQPVERHTQWFPVDQLPPLAFDHSSIVAMAHERLKAKLEYSTIAFQFLPRSFTLSELQQVYESIQGEALDKRNFRKWILSMNRLQATGKERRNGAHRPAKLYRLKQPGLVEIIR